MTTPLVDYRAQERERRTRMGVPIIPVRSVTASETVRESDRVLIADATAGAIVLTLPPAAVMRGRRLTVKLIDAASPGVTLDGAGSETIDGALTLAWTTRYQTYTILSDGSVWWTI